MEKARPFFIDMYNNLFETQIFNNILTTLPIYILSIGFITQLQSLLFNT